MTNKQLIDKLKALAIDMNDNMDNYDNDGGNGTATINLLSQYVDIIDGIIDNIQD